MIDVKQSVKIASDYVNQLYGTDQLEQLALEEVELTDNDQFWLVTLGFSLRELKQLFDSCTVEHKDKSSLTPCF